MQSNEEKYTRQGDLLFIPVASIPKNIKERKRKTESRVLEVGEATGHAHAVAEADATHVEIYDPWHQEGHADYLRVTGDGISIVHESAKAGDTDVHRPVTLSPGAYQVRRAREYDYLARLDWPVAD